MRPDGSDRLQAMAFDAVAGAIRDAEIPKLGALARRALDEIEATHTTMNNRRSPGRWQVDRVDEHGTRSQVVDGLTHQEAEQVVAWSEARGHEQTYQVAPSNDPKRWGLSQIEPVDVEVVDADRYRPRITFEPRGLVRAVDLSDGLRGPAFQAVHNPEVFVQVSVDPAAATIV